MTGPVADHPGSPGARKRDDDAQMMCDFDVHADL